MFKGGWNGSCVLPTIHRDIVGVKTSVAGDFASAGGTKADHTQALVENSVKEGHRFARESRPAILDDLGLISAQHAYSKNLAARKKSKSG